jgi:hypothetical protein
VAPAPAADDSAKQLALQSWCARAFWGWLLTRTALWTLLVSLTQRNGPLDLIEWLSWGHEWQWGYHKHPPLPAWIAEVFSRLSPGSVWGVYLAGYMVTAFSLWSVWRLGREVLSPRLALLAAMTLDGVVYYTFDAGEYSNNVVLNGFWALAVLCCHRALRTDWLGWWLGLGTAVGLALLSKYSVLILLVCLVGFTLIWPEARRCWRRPGPYLAAGLALLLVAPHLAWLVNNDFLTVRYARASSDDVSGWLGHVKNPTLFALSQLGRLLPVLFILVPLTTWRWRWRRLAAGQEFDRAFLLAAVLGPVGLQLMLSAALGIQLREIWGYPLWTFLGLLILVCVRLEDSARVLRPALQCWGVVVALFCVFTVVKNSGIITAHGAQRVQFPGRELARVVLRRWQGRFSRPFPLVAGDCWLSSNVGCYARHRPSVYFSPGFDYLELDARVAPWTSDADLRHRGGVLIWNAAHLGDGLPPLFRRRFPEAQWQPPVVLPCPAKRSGPPVRAGLAFIPPANADASR